MNRSTERISLAVGGVIAGMVIGAVANDELAVTPTSHMEHHGMHSANDAHLKYGQSYTTKSGIDVSAKTDGQCSSNDGTKRGTFVTITVKNFSDNTIDPTTMITTHAYDMKGVEATVEASEYHKDIDTILAPGQSDYSKMCFVNTLDVPRVTLDNFPLVEWTK